MKRWTQNGLTYKQDERGRVWYLVDGDWFLSSKPPIFGYKRRINAPKLNKEGKARRGKIKVGDVFESENYGPFTVVNITNDKVAVQFPSGYIKAVDPATVKSGRIKDKLKPTFYGVGYPGDGPHKYKSRAHKCWTKMLRGCYQPSEKADGDKFRGVTVCDEWLNFQVFADWYVQTCDNDDLMVVELIKGSELNPATTRLVKSPEQLKRDKKKPQPEKEETG